mgnify:CR=1 FL=1
MIEKMNENSNLDTEELNKENIPNLEEKNIEPIVEITEIEEKVENKKPKLKRKNLKYVLSILFLIALVVTTIILLATRYNFGEMMEIVGSLNYWFLILGVAMIFIYILFEAIAMKILLKTINLNESLWHNVEYSAIDYFFCAVTPSATGGQPMVMYYMKKDGVPIAETTIILLMNTALFKIVLMILSIVALIAYPGYILATPLIAILFFLGFAFNLFIVIMCFLGAFKRRAVQNLMEKIIRLLHKMKIVKNLDLVLALVEEKMNDYEKAANLIKAHKGKFFLAFLANLIQRMAMFSMTYCVYLSFLRPYPDLVGHGYFEMMAIQVIIALSVDSLPFPGGVGISELLYIQLYEIIYETEIMVGSVLIVTRALSFYIPLLVTMLIFIYKHISTMVKSSRKKEN